MSKIIDVHAHLLPRSALEAVRAGGTWFGSGIEEDHLGRPRVLTMGRSEGMGGAAHYESMERRIERMDEMGVDIQVLSLNPIFFRHYLDVENAIGASQAVNDEIAGFVEQWPDRFAGYGALPAQDAAAAVAELERVMAMPGMIGASVGTHVGGLNWDEPQLFPILEAAESLAAVLFFHPSDRRLEQHLPRYHLHNTIANPTETTITIGSMIFGGVLDRLPGLKMLFVHGGGYACWAGARWDHAFRVRPESQEQIGRLPSDYLPMLWYDSLVHGYENLHRLVEIAGIERVMLGTDFPADMGQPEPVTWIEGSGLDASAQAAILGGNASDLLGL